MVGNLSTVTQSLPTNTDPTTWLARTTMTYDGYGRKLTMNDPDMGEWTYTYDAAGNLSKQLDANDDRLCFYYDKLNRLIGKYHDAAQNGCTNSAVQLAAYTYYTSGTGKTGQLQEIRWSNSASQNKETFDYDSLGRLTTHTRLIDNRSYTMSYSGFDALHRPTTTTYPNGQTAVTTYDHEGPNTLANSGTNLISDIRYNGLGQLTYLQRSSGSIHTSYLYHPQTDLAGSGGLGDSNFRLQTIQHGAAGTSNAWPDFSYQYDRVGNITQMETRSTNGTDTQSFAYDHLHRLTSASATGVSPTYSDSYAYNTLGNLITNDGVTQTYGSSHIHAVTSANGVTYGYDNNGNMISRDATDTVNDYTHTFNAENELIIVDNNNNFNHFRYDAASIRVKSTVGREATYYPFPGYEENVLNPGQSWHFNEGSGTTANDSSSHNQDGTIQGATWTNGINGQALNFDGVNDWIEFSGSVGNEGAFTISGWLRPEQLPTGSGRMVASTYQWNSTPSSQRGWYFGDTHGNTDHFTFGLFDDEGNQAQAVYDNFFSQYLNQWVHVVGVYKPGQSVALYINGQQVASDTSSVPDKVSLTSLFKVGARADNTSQGFWDGQIDALQLFGYDLTPTEIQALANKNFNGVPAESQTTRLTFSIAGQAVALKVMGSSTATYYLYNDHLGSTSTMSTTSGGTISGSTSRYYPFGGWRTEPTAGLTDRGFTGHLHNNLGNAPDDIGLVYMQARWYSPALGRFISADVLVPNPANPQAYNRYAYVENRPLDFNDPTGHCKNGRGTGTGTCQVDGGAGFADGSLIQTGDNVPQVLTDSELGTIGTIASFVPYLDTGDDVATAFTGCGYACQAGSEEPVNGFWRGVAAIGIVAPFGSSLVRHSVDEVAGVVSHYGDDIVEATGQWHHVLSNKINSALSRHETLAGVFGRNDMMVQALDRESHNGYQTWHRLYDDDAVEWLRDPANRQAAPEQFLQYLRGVYERSDMQERFPGATQLIDMVLEELP